jgi:hypothetical protein
MVGFFGEKSTGQLFGGDDHLQKPGGSARAQAEHGKKTMGKILQYPLLHGIVEYL